MDVSEAVERLGSILPLAERQRRLPRPLAEAHRAILRSLAERGRPPSPADVGDLVSGDGREAIAELARSDLVVLDGDGAIVGAYPLTTADTPHRVSVGASRVNAMCALDALAVAPMFGTAVTVESVCHVTGEPVRVVQEGRQVRASLPTEGIHVGVRWGPVGAAAAGSL